MVFPGRFSTGCMRCRQRKVKCDENKPSCRRCYIYGKPCPGYTDQFHFRHGLSGAKQAQSSGSGSGSGSGSSNTSNKSNKPSNNTPMTTTFQITNDAPRVPRSRKKAAAAKKAEDGTNEDAAADANKANANNTTSLALTTTSNAQKPSIAPRITISQDWMSLCYFMRRFVSPDGSDSFPGHLNFLPMLYDQHRQGPLEMAGLSVAQMAAYNAFGSDAMRLQSYQNYGRAVKYLQQSIQDADSATDDKVLATVLLLCTFKDMSGEGSGDPSEHASGLYYLLEKRGPGQLVNRQGMELFLFSLLRLQVHSFLHEDDKYVDPGGLATFFGAWDPLLRALSMMSRILHLRHTLFTTANAAVNVSLQRQQQQQQQQQQSPPQQQHMSQQSSPTDPYGNVSPKSEHTSSPEPSLDPYIDPYLDSTTIQECFDALEDFDAWDADAPSYWQSMFEDRTAPGALGEVAASRLHYDVETACVIILIRSARLILMHGMLDYHARMQMATAGEYGLVGGGIVWNDCVHALEQDTQATISDMLWCVPYALGDVDLTGKVASIQSDGAGALVILQSMRLVTYCRFATAEQTLLAQSILNRMNTTIGVKAAISWDEEIESQSNLAAFQGLTVSDAAFTPPSTVTPSPPPHHMQ